MDAEETNNGSDAPEDLNLSNTVPLDPLFDAASAELEQSTNQIDSDRSPNSLDVAWSAGMLEVGSLDNSGILQADVSVFLENDEGGENDESGDTSEGNEIAVGREPVSKSPLARTEIVDSAIKRATRDGQDLILEAPSAVPMGDGDLYSLSAQDKAIASGVHPPANLAFEPTHIFVENDNLLDHASKISPQTNQISAASHVFSATQNTFGQTSILEEQTDNDIISVITNQADDAKHQSLADILPQQIAPDTILDDAKKGVMVWTIILLTVGLITILALKTSRVPDNSASNGTATQPPTTVQLRTLKWSDAPTREPASSVPVDILSRPAPAVAPTGGLHAPGAADTTDQTETQIRRHRRPKLPLIDSAQELAPGENTNQSTDIDFD
ncbi:MAG: hypothetical protein SGJ27_25365 [Candidatus Melainabacteria bacterium]|nr:hypothetical protein [Candidatus Melainabacteria bacterium]